MEEGTLIVLGCTLAVVVVALIGAAFQERRGKHLREAAEEMGFTFQPEDPALAAELFGPAAQAVRVQNVLRGEAQGLEVVVFDLLQLLRRAQYIRHVRFTVLFFRDEDADWPSFALHPRGYQTRLGGGNPAGQAVLENDADFARRWRLEAPDSDRVSEMFTEDVRRYFTTHTGLWVQGAEKKLIYSQGNVMPASSLRAFLESGFEVMNLLRTGEQRQR